MITSYLIPGLSSCQDTAQHVLLVDDMLRLRVEKNWSFWAQWTIPLINFQELSTQSSTKLGYNHDYSITLVNKVSQHKTLNLQNDEKKPQKATYTLSLQVFSFGKKGRERLRVPFQACSKATTWLFLNTSGPRGRQPPRGPKRKGWPKSQKQTRM